MSRTTTVETHPSLMRRLEIGNDEAAWQEFAARYAPLIRRYAYSCGLQHNDAEDVCQLTLIKLTRTFESFRYDPARGRFRDYLGRVVRSVIASEIARPIARRGTVFTIDPALEVADPTPVTDPEWENQWRLHHLELAMANVRKSFDAQSLAIFDLLSRGANPERLAADFGVSRDAIYKVKQRVRDRLKDLVRRQIDDEESAEPKRADRPGRRSES
jgi:RNA polymerase sigma factor (sigma-70 family)